MEYLYSLYETSIPAMPALIRISAIGDSKGQVSEGKYTCNNNFTLQDRRWNAEKPSATLDP